MDSAVEVVQQLDVKMLISVAVLILGSCGVICKVIMTGFSHMNSRLDRMEARLDRMEARLDRMEARLDKMQETITDIDRRRLEGAFQSKDCCLLKSDYKIKAAE